VTKLIITENLISDINQIKSEINIDESIVSISQEEFTANNTAALFQSDNFQFVSDSFVTYSDLKKMNYDFNEKYEICGEDIELSLDLREKKDYIIY